MKIISRKAAKAKGLKHYFTGTPCKNGHLDERFVGNKNCATCGLLRKRRWVASHPEAERLAHLLRDRRYKARHPEKVKLSRLLANRRWNAKFPNRKRFLERLWYARHVDAKRFKNRLYYNTKRERILLQRARRFGAPL